MKVGLRRSVYLTLGAAAASGIPLFVYRQVLGPPPDDALMHTGEGAVLAAHVLLAPWVLFVCGVLWPVHVLPRLRGQGGPRRPTGVVLAWSLFPLALAGYLGQVIEAESARAVIAALHGYLGVAWVSLFIVHVLRRPRRAADVARRAP